MSAADGGGRTRPDALDEPIARRHLPVVDERRPKRTGARARTISARRLSVRELRFQGDITTPLGIAEHRRPETRGECLSGEVHAVRPCPFVSCKHHLYLDVSEATGNIKLNFPDLAVWQLRETCALDVADRGGATLDEIGRHLNLTRERVRQLSDLALARLRGDADAVALLELADRGEGDR